MTGTETEKMPAAAASTPVTLSLWPGDAPLARGAAPEDRPEITVYLPPAGRASGSAVLVCPGGGYGVVVMSYEGHDIARWLTAQGIAGIVLKYRVAPYRQPAPLLDAQRALRTVRCHANEWGIDPAKIGVMGFSAGGHLAATLATHYDAGDPKSADPVERQGCRPDFQVLVYPVISLGPQGHDGSTANLLGPDPAPALIEELSAERQVTRETPPAFLAHSVTDSVVPVANSELYQAALQAHGVPVELLRLLSGDHGLGCGSSPEWTQWQAACRQWLAARRLSLG